MSDFDPKKHMIKLSGKDYLPVSARIVWFRTEHPDGTIETEEIEASDKHARYRAQASYPFLLGDTVVWARGTGHGQGWKTAVQRGEKYVERAETVAIGRALASLGYGTEHAGDEFTDTEPDQPQPTQRQTQRQPDNPPRQAPPVSRSGASNPEQAPATERQVKFLFAMAREMGMSDDALEHETREMYGKTPDTLTRREASTLIERMQNRREADNRHSVPSVSETTLTGRGPREINWDQRHEVEHLQGELGWSDEVLHVFVDDNLNAKWPALTYVQATKIISALKAQLAAMSPVTPREEPADEPDGLPF